MTALLPVVLFPLLNIMGASDVSQQYFNNGMMIDDDDDDDKNEMKIVVFHI